MAKKASSTRKAKSGTKASKRKPLKKSAAKPAKKATGKSASKSAKKAAKKPLKKPTKKAVKKTAKKAAKKPAPKAAKKAAPKAARKAASKPAKKSASKPAKKPAARKATAKVAKKGKAKPTKKSTMTSKPASKTTGRKSGGGKTAARKNTFERIATRIPNKGVLIRLKRTGPGYTSDGKEILREVKSVEKSKGATPITLHHRRPTSKELIELRELLLQRRNQLMGDVRDLEAGAFSEETQHVSTNHLADSSSEQYEQEFTLSMIENETEELKEIGRALEKIEGGNYGECEACGIDISIERLQAMPYTRICIHCRTKFEEEGGGEEYGVFPERRI
jgi:RNA polymerase-binding protein DksA